MFVSNTIDNIRVLLFISLSLSTLSLSKAQKATEQDTSKNLQTVEILGRKATNYRNEASFIGSKTATELKNLPTSVSYVTKELMQDQQAMRVGDVVKNFAGVNQYSHYDDFTVRGFRVQGGEGGVQLVNGMRSTTGFWKQPLTNYLERVEVIKGPASALFGNASPGGTINRVTKKPLLEPRKAVSFTTGSFNTLRVLTDFTGPMNKEQTLLYRLNVGYENSGSFRDLQYDKNLVVAPSVSFLPTDKTRINVDLLYNSSDSRLDRGQAVTQGNDIYAVPISKSLNLINDFLKEQNWTLTGSVSHEFSKNLRFNASYSKTGYEENLSEHRSANTFAKDSSGKTIPTLVEMQVFIRQRKRFVDNLSAYFNYDFKVGKIENRLVVGYDYGQETQPFGGSQLQANGYRNNTNTAATAYNATRPTTFTYETVNGIKRPVPNVAHFDLTAVSPYYIADMSKYFYTRSAFDPTFYAFNGIYIQDQIKFGRLHALVGLRRETYNDRTNFLKPTETKAQTEAWLPRVGMVFEVTKNINAYATYSQGFQPQTAARLTNPNAGGPFDPLSSRLFEGGLKTEWFDKKLSVTLSAYQIELKNVLYPAPTSTNPDLLRQIGAEKATGFEFEAIGNILPNWTLMASYAYNDAAIAESPVTAEIGRQKPNAPANTANIWTKYVLDGEILRGLGVGFGANYVDKRLGSIIGATGKTEPEVLPAYEVINAAIYYKFDKYQFQINFNNIANKTYWVGGYDFLRLFPGAPRNFLASVAYTF
jgi:iron complex outermembrane receptor protein